MASAPPSQDGSPPLPTLHSILKARVWPHPVLALAAQPSHAVIHSMNARMYVRMQCVSLSHTLSKFMQSMFLKCPSLALKPMIFVVALYMQIPVVVLLLSSFQKGRLSYATED